ncbi:MAG: hypothetical protein U1D96_03495 [Eubacteriales bacterium]|nr:hypothetical protein [Eubacteriales bacterium]
MNRFNGYREKRRAIENDSRLSAEGKAEAIAELNALTWKGYLAWDSETEEKLLNLAQQITDAKSKAPTGKAPTPEEIQAEARNVELLISRLSAAGSAEALGRMIGGEAERNPAVFVRAFARVNELVDRVAPKPEPQPQPNYFSGEPVPETSANNGTRAGARLRSKLPTLFDMAQATLKTPAEIKHTEELAALESEHGQLIATRVTGRSAFRNMGVPMPGSIDLWAAAAAGQNIN